MDSTAAATASAASVPNTIGARVTPSIVGERSYIDHITGYLSGAAQLLPQSLMRTLQPALAVATSPIAPAVNSADPAGPDSVEWMCFQSTDVITSDGSVATKEFLVIGYAATTSCSSVVENSCVGGGVQVWSLNDPNVLVEVLSKRGELYSCARFLPLPALQSDSIDHFAEQRPLLALSRSTRDEVTGAFTVPVYSLALHTDVHSFCFRSPVHAIEVNRHVIVVSLTGNLFAFSATSFENLFCVAGCYPTSPTSINPLALGARWLAHTTVLPAPHLSVSVEGNKDRVPTNFDVAKDVAKDIASGLLYLTDMGYQAAKHYWKTSSISQQQQQQQRNGSSSLNSLIQESGDGTSTIAIDVRNAAVVRTGGVVTPGTAHAGSVIIRDVRSPGHDVIAHFQAHTGTPVSALAFDKSGQLLVTASTYGHNFNVFRIVPPSPSPSGDVTGSKDSGTSQNWSDGRDINDLGSNAGSSSSNPGHVQHLYRLHRGITSAIIQDISFSVDSRWVILSSTRGTTHIYAIHPSGGKIGPHTHIPTCVPNSASEHISTGLDDLLSTKPPSLFTEQAVARIKHPLPLISADGNAVITNGSIDGNCDNGDTSAVVATRFLIPPQSDKEIQLGFRVYVATHAGFLLQYTLKPEKDTTEQDNDMLLLDVRPTLAWPILRSRLWPTVQAPLKSILQTNVGSAGKSTVLPLVNSPTSGSSLEGSNDIESESNSYTEDKKSTEKHAWLSQVEICTHRAPVRAVWQGPQFTFRTFTSKTSANELRGTGLVLSPSDNGNNTWPEKSFERSTDVAEGQLIDISSAGANSTNFNLPSSEPLPVSVAASSGDQSNELLWLSLSDESPRIPDDKLQASLWAAITEPLKPLINHNSSNTLKDGPPDDGGLVMDVSYPRNDLMWGKV